MNSTVTMLRSVAAVQAESVEALIAGMTPAGKAQVAAVTAAVVGTLCTTAADALESQVAGSESPVAVTALDLSRKILAKNDALRKAGASGNWEELDRLIDAYINEPPKEGVEN